VSETEIKQKRTKYRQALEAAFGRILDQLSRMPEVEAEVYNREAAQAAVALAGEAVEYVSQHVAQSRSGGA
jgi:hypothetical protein